MSNAAPLLLGRSSVRSIDWRGSVWNRFGDEFVMPPHWVSTFLDGSSPWPAPTRESLKLLAFWPRRRAAAWLGRDYTPVRLGFFLRSKRSSTGEQRRVQLDDGSLVQLNSDSAADSDF